MRTVAITGGIACGKTSVGGYLSGKGVPVCDSDELAHEAIRASGEVYDDVVRCFGSGVLDEAGEIDRRLLGAIVFRDKSKREVLNAIVHPVVLSGLRRWVKAVGETTELAAVIIPLLYEAGMEGEWDTVICVWAEVDVQVDRLCSRGLEEQEARLRIDAQLPIEEKVQRADYVIYNNGTSEWMEEQAERVLARILEK